MKKILLITSELPPQPGGIGTHAHQLARNLSRFYKVTVLADRRSDNGTEEAIFDQQQDYRIHRVKRRSIIAFTYVQRIITTLKVVDEVDIVLVSGKFSLWQAWFIKKKNKDLPVLGIIHGSEVLLGNSFLRKFTNYCLEQLDVVIGVSSYTLDLVNKLQLKRKLVIPNGVEVGKELIENHTKKLSQQINLITVGNLTQRKGQHNLIKALPDLARLYPNINYNIVGIPTSKVTTEELAKQLKVDARIKIHGRVSDEEKQDLLKVANIFVMLSERTASGDVEGFGIAILEANLLGLPALGSSNSGIEDAISDYTSGRLVNPHNTKEITQALAEIIDNYTTYSTQAQLHAKKFDWNKVVLKYKEVIEESLGR